MKCEHCQEWLNQYIDYELSAEESAWVEEHISVCSSCRQEYNELVYTKQASLSIPDFIPPNSFSKGWKAAVLADMTPQPAQIQPAANPRKNTQTAAQPRRSGLQRTVRRVALIAAVLGVGIISVQAYNYFSAIREGSDLARAPITTEQIDGNNAGSNAGLQQAATPEQTWDFGGGINEDIGIDSTNDTQMPETDTYGNEEESGAEGRGESMLPQTAGSLNPPASIAPSEVGEDDDAHSAINGVKEVSFSAPIDKEMIEASLDKENIIYKILEDVYVIEVDNSNIKAVNKVLNELGSTETMVSGETLHIKLK